MSIDATTASDETRASIVAYIREEAARLEAIAVKFFDKAADAKYGGLGVVDYKSHGREYRLHGQFLDVMATKISKKIDLMKVCVSPEGT